MAQPLRRGSLPCALTLLLLSCTGDSPTAPLAPVPATVRAGSETVVSGTAGSALASTLVVTVVDAEGRGVRNAEVSWSVSADGGSLESSTARTDSLGRSRNQWTLGVRPGTHSVTAALAGLAPVVFTATVVAPTPAKAEAAGGGGQSGAVGALLADSLVVRVTTASGAPAPGVAVSWRFVTGDGAIGSESMTNAAGVVKGGWTLGITAGEQMVEAIVAGLESAPVSFRATARAGSPARLAKVSGDAQSALVGARLAEPVVARVTDTHGNGIAGASVTWSVAAGGGSISPGISVTDSAGRGSASWTLGATPGANQLTAAGAGQTQIFAATAVRPKLPAASVVAAAGGNQRAAAGSELAEPLVVRVVDREGSPVEGAAVSWSVSGGGSLSAASSASGADGLARTRLSLGSAVVSQRVTATVAGVETPATFAATATGVKASGVAIVGSVSTLSVGDTARLLARATDAAGVILLDRTTGWTSAGPGTATVSSSGLVTAVAPGETSITATIDGRSASVGVTVRAPTADAIELVSGGGSYTPRTTVTVVVRTRRAGRPLPGVVVLWRIDGAATPPGLTDADGLARLSWTLGTRPQVVSAATSGVAEMQIPIGIAPGPLDTLVISAPGSTLLVGGSLQFTARGTDADGVAISAPPVVWNSSNPAAASVDATGRAVGVAVGSAIITGTSGGRSHSLPLSVVDRSGPRLTGIAITPTSIDVTTGSASIAITLTVTDESGVRTDLGHAPTFTVRRPDGAEPNFYWGEQVAGDQKTGSYRANVFYAPGVMAGVWSIANFFMEDIHGNKSGLSGAAAQALGFPLTWTVVNNAAD